MVLPEVADLIDLVAGEDDPLERLAAAEELAAQLAGIADRLLGSVVDDIRAAGCSWADIGAQLGVTRQAAQQRYSARLSSLTISDIAGATRFERFTPRTRDVLLRADQGARAAGAPAVTPRHLLGAVLDGDNVAVASLGSTGADVARLRKLLLAKPRRSVVGDAPPVPVSDEARRCLEATLTEALGLGHNYIGTEHVLLGTLHDHDIAGVVGGHGITLATARDAVRCELSKILRARS